MAAHRVCRAVVSQLVLLVVAVLGVTAACDSPVAVDRPESAWTLVSVNGQPLPAPYPDPSLPQNVFEVTEGRLSVWPDRSIVLELRMRCAPGQTEDECTVEGDGGHRHEGLHAATGDEVVLDDRSYPAEMGEDRIVFTVQVPPSMGTLPMYVLEFTPAGDG